jgi:hypothetical protein
MNFAPGALLIRVRGVFRLAISWPLISYLPTPSNFTPPPAGPVFSHINTQKSRSRLPRSNGYSSEATCPGPEAQYYGGESCIAVLDS